MAGGMMIEAAILRMCYQIRSKQKERKQGYIYIHIYMGDQICNTHARTCGRLTLLAQISTVECRNSHRANTRARLGKQWRIRALGARV